MANTYEPILTKGPESALPSVKEDGKIRFTTDTGRLFVDGQNARTEISDFIKGMTEDEIKSQLAPLANKVYISSDTNKFMIFNESAHSTEDEWINIANSGQADHADEADEATHASTADYATNSGTATYATNAGTSVEANHAANASTATYANNSGTVNGKTVAENVPSGAKFTDTTYTGANGISLSGTTFSNSGVRSIAAGGSNGTINVNTNGTTANVAVTGLKALAYKDSLGKSDVGLGNVANLDQSKAIKSITRSGTTFTATAVDGTTSSFTQQDSNTTYAAGAGIALNSSTFSNSGVRSVATGGTNGTIIVNTNGSTAEVPVKGLGSAAYTNSTAYIASNLKGANNGVAELDSAGKVPSSQLPSFVDDVLEYNSLSDFPTTGESGKIYVAKDVNLTYRWSGTAYVEISASLALGETSATAYRGDRGKVAYDHSQATGNPHGTTKANVGLGNVANIDQSKAIKSITRSGTTFTATALDGTTSSFTQQDNNTTYSANNGVGLSGTTFYNSGVRAAATGTTNGTININTNGTTADVAIKGLAALAYKASLGKSDVGLGNVANLDQSKAIKSITRSGTTFTTTAVDGTTSSFTQQDSNTTYAAGAGIALNSGTFSNSGVRAVAAGGSNGTINVNTNGTTANVAVTGLKALAYKDSLAKGDVGLGNVANLDQSKAIKSITRSGTTFTATAIDGTTSSFTQQDSNTTYTANNGVGLSGTTFYNSGVRAIATGTTAGTINVNTNGSTANVAVKDAGKGVKSITRSGTTFTATAIDGSTFSFTQQDSNTTYSANNGVTLSGTTFSNSGVRSIATGTSNGTINVNTNGSTANVAVKGLGSAAYTASTAYAASGHTHNYAGSSSAGGAANSLANFQVSTTTGISVDTPGTNTVGYTSGLTKANWNYNQTDGSLYSQFYNASWIHEIFGDYKTGQISVRGKNNGTWQSWRRIIDESNYSSIISAANLSGLTKSQVTTALGYTPPTTNTTYTGSNGITLSGTNFTNSGVRAAATGTTNGTININTNGTTADVAVKGLADLAYKASLGKSDVGLGNVANLDQSKAIKSITRSGTTFTTTAVDGTTSSFTQQDSNTTYAAGAGIALNSGTFSNSGVRSIATGTSNGTININTNGTTADVAVKGLGAMAYKASVSKSDVGLGNVTNYDQAKAIKSITRSGTTFTATALDGTTSSFTQQDNNTTYTGANGITLSGTTFSNSGVRSIATGTSNGTINVNTNGSTANIAVKGLGSAAYTASTAYAAASHNHDSTYLKLTGGTITGSVTATNGFVGNLTGIASTASYASVVLQNPTTQNTYYPVWVNSSGDGKQLRTNDGLRLLTLEGTAETEGTAIFGVGNPTATGTAGNKKGTLRIYSSNGKQSNIVSESAGDHRTIHLPDKSGTVAMTSDVNTRLPVAGGSMTGALNFANNTWNNVGDDVAIGDINAGGTLGIKGLNGQTCIRLVPYSGSTYQTISTDGNGVMNISGHVKAADSVTATHFPSSWVGTLSGSNLVFSNIYNSGFYRFVMFGQSYFTDCLFVITDSGSVPYVLPASKSDYVSDVTYNSSSHQLTIKLNGTMTSATNRYYRLDLVSQNKV